MVKKYLFVLSVCSNLFFGFSCSLISKKKKQNKFARSIVSKKKTFAWSPLALLFFSELFLLFPHSFLQFIFWTPLFPDCSFFCSHTFCEHRFFSESSSFKCVCLSEFFRLLVLIPLFWSLCVSFFLETIIVVSVLFFFPLFLFLVHFFFISTQKTILFFWYVWFFFFLFLYLNNKLSPSSFFFLSFFELSLSVFNISFFSLFFEFIFLSFVLYLFFPLVHSSHSSPSPFICFSFFRQHSLRFVTSFSLFFLELFFFISVVFSYLLVVMFTLLYFLLSLFLPLRLFSFISSTFHCLPFSLLPFFVCRLLSPSLIFGISFVFSISVLLCSSFPPPPFALVCHHLLFCPSFFLSPPLFSPSFSPSLVISPSAFSFSLFPFSLYLNFSSLSVFLELTFLWLLCFDVIFLVEMSWYLALSFIFVSLFH